MPEDILVTLDGFAYYAKIILLQNDEVKAELISRDLNELEDLIFQVLRSGYDVKVEINPELRKKYKSYDIIP